MIDMMYFNLPSKVYQQALEQIHTLLAFHYYFLTQLFPELVFEQLLQLPVITRSHSKNRKHEERLLLSKGGKRLRDMHEREIATLFTVYL